MREYIAQKKFHLGELTMDILPEERIKFDGFNAVIRGEKVKAPTLMACVRGGLIKEATVDADGKMLEQPPATQNMETPEQRTARVKQERLDQIRGSAGNGMFIEDVKANAASVETPRQMNMKMSDRSIQLERTATVVPSHNVDVQTNSEARENKKAAEEKLAAEKEAKKSKPLEVIQESEGEVVATVKTNKGLVEEEGDTRGFLEAMMEGKPKKLEVSKDQFVAPKVMVMDRQDDAVEIKKLVDVTMTIAPTKDPLKDWSSMTATKKEKFIKKATDTSVIKQIIDRETGAVKRKAEERLANLDGGEGLR